MCAAVVVVEVVTVAAAEELADIDLLACRIGLEIFVRGFIPGGILGFISCCGDLGGRIIFGSGRHLGGDADIAVEGRVNSVLLGVSIGWVTLDGFQLRGDDFLCALVLTDGAGDVIAAIDLVDEHIAAGILAVDVYEGVAAHIGHTGTAEQLTLRVLYGRRLVCATLHGTDVTRIDVPARAAFDIALVTTAIDVAANLDLGVGQAGDYNRQD